MSRLRYNIHKIEKIVGGSLLAKGSGSLIEHIILDNRKINFPETSLFFAIKGERHDGHNFIRDAYLKGVHNFVADKREITKFNIQELQDVNIITVENTLIALQALTAIHRKKVTYPVVAVTGSNGKTMVKEWLFQLMNRDKHIVRSPKSYNSQVGVPLSVWQMNGDHELAIIEAGISKAGEMQKLADIILPSVGILTNIGQAHDEGFKNKNEKLSEKLKLFRSCDTVIYCNDYIDKIQGIQNSFTWSRKQNAVLKITGINMSDGSATITGIYKKDKISITIPFRDDASIENAIHCWAFMLMMGYENVVIKERMLELSPVAMRLQLKAGVNGCTIINDTYNSDILSLNIALDLLQQQQQHQKKTLILSDILQSGEKEKVLYRKVAELISKKGIDRLIGVGKSLTNQSGCFKSNSVFYEHTNEFLREINPSSFHNEAILIKGSRPFEFERITKMLQQKDHETVLEINLNAFVHNLNVYRSKLKKDTKIMAMVKAFSYGSGSHEMANVLQYHHVDYLAVAYADEGVELRKADIKLPIMIMNPESSSFDVIVRYRLEPEIYSLRILRNFIDSLILNPETTALQPYPVHIKLDTGMHRLGFQKHELNNLTDQLLKYDKLIKVQSVFSHLAASEDVSHDEFTKLQINEFASHCKRILSKIKYPFIKHILNSGGVSRFPETQLDMVRLGIGLYGMDQSEEIRSQLQSVSTLKTTISQIKNVRKGESVGYNRRFIAKKNMKIATVGIGYADGLNRRFGNENGKMLIYLSGNSVQKKKPVFVPVIGNICMDMCMLDITDINVEEGDEVVLFDDYYTVYDIAKDCGTISYEILTSISQRVKRVYYYE